MSFDGDTTQVATLADSLLESISKITASVVCIELEFEKFMEIGCYFYRASSVIMELQTTEHTQVNAMEILQSLSKIIDLAQNLVEKFQESTGQISDTKLRSTIMELEEVIRSMGECLSLIPSSTFRDQEYAEVAVQALSKEMLNVQFEFDQDQVLKTNEPERQADLYKKLLKKKEVPEESDLYSINMEVSIPQVNEFSWSTSGSSQSKYQNISRLISLPEATHIEPLYETFFCPLTKEIMVDPVTIESGATYEKNAIMEWFETFENAEEIFCPTTGKKLMSGTLSTNIALKTTIEEWKERNEAARIKAARAALSLASSERMIFEAIKDLQTICQRKQYNKVQVRNFGIFPLLINFLEYKDRNVRCAALELLCQLVEDDDDGKEVIANTMDISVVVKMLSSSHRPVRHASLLFLLELSRSQSLCEKIGSVIGGILMLITIKYNRTVDAFGSEKAEQILSNLEGFPGNIKCMAENGLLEPLIYHLNEGCEEMQIEMASYLGERVLGPDNKTYVAERVAFTLIRMVKSGNTLLRRPAFKALEQISSYHPNSRILVEIGIVQIMAKEMFSQRSCSEPMNSKAAAAAIVANILESGIEHESLQVNTHGHTMTSDFVLYNLIYMLKNSTPDKLNINLIRILSCLTKSPKSMPPIVSIVKETEASYTLIELINNPHEELGVAAIKLLIVLSPYLGHTLVERLCKTRGQPESLIHSPSETIRISEKQAVSAKFLAKLPHQNLTLNLALLSKNVVPTILQTIDLIQRSGTRTSRYASDYLEGLVGILVRFTSTLYEPQILFLAKAYNFTSVFTELLIKTSCDEVQKLSAFGLENLSSESINLSKPPQIKKTKFSKPSFLPNFLSFGSSKTKNIPVCPVHRGACSSQNTFCLIDAKAVDRLLMCLEHENVEVVEAALSALCTLLDDKVDVDKSVSVLSEVNAIQHVLNVIKDHKEEGLWQKSFWMIERFLVKGGRKSASDISQDRSLPVSLVSAFHHGDVNTRQMAEKILMHLNKMPNISAPNYTLHDRALMQYGDILEASGKGLPELLNLSTGDLSSQFGMKRGHVARFMDRTSACASPQPKSYALPPRKTTSTSRNNSIYKAYGSVNSTKLQNRTGSLQRYSRNYDKSLEQSLADFKIKDGYIFKGIVAAGPPEPRACGCVQSPPVTENVAPYSAIENISIQKITPQYKIGVERLVKSKTPPMKASELWREKPAVILCIRRPGCIMCRAEAHQLYTKKPIFDALGIQLFAVLHEYMESEVKDFWPRYWGGVVLYDQSMEFFRALGGGKLLKDKFLSGFLLNPRAIANYKRAKATGAELSLKGEGEIKGGLFIVGGGRSGIAYQFVERNFGDWAPLAEVIEICAKLQNQQQGQWDSINSMQERE